MNTLQVTSPYDGKIVGEVPFNTRDEVKNAIDLAHNTFENNQIPKYKRVEILENVVKIMSSQI